MEVPIFLRRGVRPAVRYPLCYSGCGPSLKDNLWT
jgi:hypothetical protein